MDKYELEYKLDRAISAITPDMQSEITAKNPQYRTQGGAMDLSQVQNTKSKKGVYGLASMAACACLVVGIFGYQNYFAICSVVEIDVNPSISLSLNKQDTVLKAEGGNEDGTQLLNTVSVENQTLAQAVDTIMDEMVSQGYLDAQQNAVLITVKANQEEHRVLVKEKATSATKGALEQVSITPTLITQSTTMTKDVTAQELSQRLDVSYSKALLLLDITAHLSNLSTDQLATMTIDEICDYYDDQLDFLEDAYDDHHPMEESIDALDDLLDDLEDKDQQTSQQTNQQTNTMIGAEQAKAIAMDYIGVSSVGNYDIEQDDDCYEIEFTVGTMEYEFEINAYSGAIEKFEKEVDDDD